MGALVGGVRQREDRAAAQGALRCLRCAASDGPGALLGSRPALRAARGAAEDGLTGPELERESQLVGAVRRLLQLEARPSTPLRSIPLPSRPAAWLQSTWMRATCRR